MMKPSKKDPAAAPVGAATEKVSYPCLREMKLSDIIPDPKNPRKKLTDEEMGRLKTSLSELGNLQPVVFNIRTGKLLGGHQRLKAYQQLGEKVTQVWCVDIDANKARKAMLALNNVVGRYDDTLLRDILNDLQKVGENLESTLFEKDWLTRFMDKAKVPTIGEAISELKLEAVYENVGWMVIRCPDSLIPALREAIAPVVEPVQDQVQVETNNAA